MIEKEPHRIRIDGYAIRVKPALVAVPYVEDKDGPMDTWVNRDGWEAECCGIRAHGLTPAQAAQRVREQLG